MKWIVLGVSVAALAIGAAGCGGSSDKSGEAGGDTTATEAASTEATTTEETSTEATSTGDTSTEAIGAGLSGECKTLAEAGQKFAQAVGTATSGSDATVESAAKAFDELSAVAPDELKDDFEVLAGAMEEYLKAIRDLDLSPGETPSAADLAKIASVGEKLQSQEIEKASSEIAKWSTANCGLSTP